MIVVKYFHEEPAAWESAAEMPPAGSVGALEALEAFLARPRVYRGYLSAAEPARGISGATGVSRPETWSAPLVLAFEGLDWWTVGNEGFPVGHMPDPDPQRGLVPVPDPQHFLETARGSLLMAATHRPDAALAVRCLGALAKPGPAGRAPRMELVLAGCVVFWTETAFHGVDWALLAPGATSDAVRRALSRALPHAPSADVRSFVIPLREARSEHRFHFDRYDLDLFAAHEVKRGDRSAG